MSSCSLAFSRGQHAATWALRLEAQRPPRVWAPFPSGIPHSSQSPSYSPSFSRITPFHVRKNAYPTQNVSLQQNMSCCFSVRTTISTRGSGRAALHNWISTKNLGPGTTWLTPWSLRWNGGCQGCCWKVTGLMSHISCSPVKRQKDVENSTICN